MPNRILKDSIRTSKTVNALTDFQFRLWAYLITYVDDYGRGRAEPDILKGFVFPRRKGVTEANITSALFDLACMGLIRLYDVDGDSYLCFPTWQEHQNIRAAKSKYPAPPEIDSICNQMNSDEFKCNQMNSDSPVTRYSLLDTRYSNNEGEKVKPPRPRFTPPTVDDVKAYATERGYNISADRFVDYYTANGWRVGKNPMKDWRAAVRSWAARDQGEGHNKPAQKNPALDYQQREYREEDFGDNFYFDVLKAYGGDDP